MGRILRLSGWACLAVGVLALPSAAEDDQLREELDKLRQEVHVMRSAMLEKEIDGYLDDQPEWTAQGGGGLSGVTITAAFTTVTQGALDVLPEDTNATDGDVDINFDFAVTDNLLLWIHMTANNGNGPSFPSSLGAATYSGVTDGIGLNGTVSVNPGAVALNSAGIKSSNQVGNATLHWEMGKIDPRTRYNLNRFADDENTQFIHNQFDDTSAVLWLTDSTGRTVLGWNFWLNFGDNEQYTLTWGWFNTPGRFFDRGLFLIEFRWKTEAQGREMNLSIMGYIQEFFRDATMDGTSGGGVSWDWMLRDDIGVFVRIVVDGGDVNAVELDASFGFVFNGPIDSRPDDVLGVAFGFIGANDTVVGTVVEDSEFTIEVYYKYVRENGKLQITPHVMYVSDPGGGSQGSFATDSIFILGIRIFVPF